MSEAKTEGNANPSPRQVLLGLFVLFQIAFLISSNALGLIQWGPAKLIKADTPQGSDARAAEQFFQRLTPGFTEERGHGWNWCDELERNLRRWAQLTGQDQAWSLFAPSVAKATGWPCVLLIWDEPPAQGKSLPGTKFTFDAANGYNLRAEWNAPEPDLFPKGTTPPRVELLLSENEPRDLNNFFRIGQARLRRLEGRLYMNTRTDDYSFEDYKSWLTRHARKTIRDEHDLILEYLRMRLNAWKRDHPDQPPPKQVILLNRMFRIQGPDELHGWEGPFVVPVLRWQPDVERSSGYCLFDAFDFADERFYPLSR